MSEITIKRILGATCYYLGDDLHRPDGPAVIWPDNYNIWALHGKFHRLDGPAVVYSFGKEEWWIDGENITGDLIKWMIENEIITYWKEWSPLDWMMFVLRFR